MARGCNFEIMIRNGKSKVTAANIILLLVNKTGVNDAYWI